MPVKLGLYTGTRAEMKAGALRRARLQHLEGEARLQFEDSSCKRRCVARRSEELILNDGAGCVEGERRKIERVKDIEDVHPQLQASALAQRRSLAECHIERAIARPTE